MRISRKTCRVLLVMVLFLFVVLLNSVVVHASGNVANAIESTWGAAKSQVKSVVNNVVFPVVDLILAVLFFVKVGTSYMEYRKHGQFEFSAPAILFACLVFMLTAPLYLWGIIGM